MSKEGFLSFFGRHKLFEQETLLVCIGESYEGKESWKEVLGLGMDVALS